MMYIAMVDSESVGEMKVWGDGHKCQKSCLAVLKWAVKNKNKPTNIRQIAEATGVPTMTVDWILRDAHERKQRSTLARVAREQGYKYEINKRFWTTMKYYRTKPIISATRKT